MSFELDPATLARLEWNRLAVCLASHAATARGAEACSGDLFAQTRGAVRERLTETDEARALLDDEQDLPFGGVIDLRPVLEQIGMGRSSAAADMARVRATLEASDRIRAFLHERRERCPALDTLGSTLPDTRELVRVIGRVVTPDGEIRDDASPELKRARKRVRELERDIERRMAGYLRDVGAQGHLQDSYVTFRDGRPVLPVRADARQRVRGIVHDVSSSGTTVFIEPEAVVEAGNRLRLAHTEVEREVERLLRELAERIRERHHEIIASGDTLEVLDLALARGRLSRRLDARRPAIDDEAPIDLRQLRHPLLQLEAGLAPEEVVPNDITLPAEARCLVISGPNAGGKTIAAKAVGLAALALRAGLHVPCADGSRMPIIDAVYADIGDEQDLRAGLSTFSARMSNLARIVGGVAPRSLVIVDEVGDGTEPGEGAALAQAILEALVERGAFVVATTHFNRLKELAGGDPRFVNASAEFDPETLLPTYRVHLGAPGSSGAMWVAQRMGLDDDVVERARSLLDREDRRLEALTRSLSELRQELESERLQARDVREQSEEVREKYETRLASLRSAREQALAAMKADLEAAFRSARGEVADVVRELQRADRSSPESGRAANRAQQKLGEIRERTIRVERAHAAPEDARPAAPVEVDRLLPGTRVALAGLPGEALVSAAPDARGRVEVRVGGARMTVGTERIVRLIEGAAPRRTDVSRIVAPPVDDAPDPSRVGDALECDLRGLRVDEALDRAAAHLSRGIGHGEKRLRLIHGHGTGALRDAIRVWLRETPEALDFGPGGPKEGGDGVTIVLLER